MSEHQTQGGVVNAVLTMPIRHPLTWGEAAAIAVELAAQNLPITVTLTPAAVHVWEQADRRLEPREEVRVLREFITHTDARVVWHAAQR
jgi:hypothetical protein